MYGIWIWDMDIGYRRIDPWFYMVPWAGFAGPHRPRSGNEVLPPASPRYPLGSEVLSQASLPSLSVVIFGI
jgi:hypothetical protein